MESPSHRSQPSRSEGAEAASQPAAKVAGRRSRVVANMLEWPLEQLCASSGPRQRRGATCPSDLIHPRPYEPTSRSGGTSVVRHRLSVRTEMPRPKALRCCADRPECEPSSSDSNVLVVEAAEDGQASEVGRTIGLGWAFGWDRGLATEAFMGSSHVVVLFDELLQEPLDVMLVEHDHVVAKLIAVTVNKSIAHVTCR